VVGLQAAYTLRRFRPEDLHRVVYINRTCLPENYSSFFFLDLHRRFPETFIVAERDGEVVGYIMCRIETGFSNFGLRIVRKGHVISIAVLPEHRRQGIASALLREAMRGMQAYGVRECFLEVRVSNTPAIRLYQKMGFQIVRTVPRYYADGEAAYIMSRPMSLEG